MHKSLTKISWGTKASPSQGKEGGGIAATRVYFDALPDYQLRLPVFMSSYG